MTRYLELARIARALKAETWQRGRRTAAPHGKTARGAEAAASRPRVSAAGLVMAATSASPP